MSTGQPNTPRPAEKQSFQLYGMKWYFFAIFTLVILAATYLGKLPKGMVGAFPLMIIK
ncbi:MAG: hypothetical protein LBK43_01575 [Treponema sp.]|jgi:Na+/citrate or Na+/malate symporter|nr:hypothetical protein [Treponema sp.]